MNAWAAPAASEQSPNLCEIPMQKCLAAVLFGACLSVVNPLLAIGADARPPAASLSAEMQQLEQRARDGDVTAQLELGSAYSLGRGVDKDYAAARLWLSQAADKGNAVAQGMLAYFYRDGLGVERDLAAAARWFGKAAQQGHAASQTNLALMHEQCVAGKPDYAAAARWYAQAAERNHALSQKKLAHLYESGQGVPQDNIKAYTWYAIAGVWDSDGEDLSANDPRVALAAKMKPEQVEQANQAAMAWWENHFKQDGATP